MTKKILIRFDDICPTMNYRQFFRAKNLLDKYNMKALLGVIPDCKDPDLALEPARTGFWDMVKELQNEGHSIALHGFNHVFDSQAKGMVNNRRGSEFSGVSLEEQTKKIKKGKEILSLYGIETDIFFAPAHSYDLNTYKALAANGFQYMSDGKSNMAYIREGVKSLPCRSSGCPHIKGDGYYTAVFHAHEWTRKDKAKGYDSLVNLLENYHDDIVTFEEYKEQPVGNYALMRMNEMCFVSWDCYLKPFLSKVKHGLLG